MCESNEYHIWQGIRSRCCNPDNPDYKNYGGRGIGLYEPWQTDFQSFYDYVGPRPSKLHSIDRKDNDRGYEPGNIRWVTRDIQVANRRCTVKITYDGETRTIREWAEITGLRPCTILSRLKYGKTPEEILTLPLHSNKGRPKIGQGEADFICARYDAGAEVTEIADMLGVSRGCVQSVIRGHAPRGVVAKPTTRKLLPPHPSGEDHRSSKLSAIDVREIRRLYDEGKLTMRQIGDRFGITARCAAIVGKRQSWRNLPDITERPSPVLDLPEQLSLL
jgi:hypothetical protein